MAIKICLFVLSIVIISCGPAKYSLKEENDYFTFFNKDISYTQGLELSVEDETGASYAVGQRIYTPEQKKRPDVVEDERPYAGHVYASYARNIESLEGFYYGAQAGILGPLALGKETQCGVHELLDIYCPAGWGNQLRDEPTLNIKLGFKKTKEVQFILRTGYLENHIEAHAGTMLFEVQTASRYHYPLTPRATLFFGPKGHYVLHDTLLDGSLFQDSPHTVESKSFYVEFEGGVKIQFKDFEIVYALVISSPQYKEEDNTYNYGAVTISWLSN